MRRGAYTGAYGVVFAGCVWIMSPLFYEAILKKVGEKVGNFDEWRILAYALPGGVLEKFVAFSQNALRYDFVPAGNTVTSFVLVQEGLCRER